MMAALACALTGAIRSGDLTHRSDCQTFGRLCWQAMTLPLLGKPRLWEVFQWRVNRLRLIS